MQFEKLKISTHNLKPQLEFYGQVLGFPILENNSDQVTFNTGATALTFSQKIPASLYHFAFLIPTGSLEAALSFLESKGISLLPLQGDTIIHFDSGRSIYFYDPDGNIAEFIERPELNYPGKNSFQISDVIRINEIGLPVSDPLVVSHELMTEYGIRPINPKAFRDNFCWVGDHEGAIIVVREGRHWLPTDIPSRYNDFELEYLEQNTLFKLKSKSGKSTSF